jgi:hypothetical protein
MQFDRAAPRVKIRPHERCAWHGPALLVTDDRGECGGRPEAYLTGFYFRETRYPVGRHRGPSAGPDRWCARLVGRKARS